MFGSIEIRRASCNRYMIMVLAALLFISIVSANPVFRAGIFPGIEIADRQDSTLTLISGNLTLIFHYEKNSPWFLSAGIRGATVQSNGLESEYIYGPDIGLGYSYKLTETWSIYGQK